MNAPSHGWWKAGVVAALLAAGVVQVAAGFALLGLQADGAYCLRVLLTGPGFACIETARRVVQMLMEAPTLAALLLGLHDLHATAVIFSLSLQLLPLLLTALACALAPATQPRLMLLPLVAYFAGSSPVASIGMNEGPSATAWFWVMFYGVLRVPERRAPMAVLALGAVATLFVHEVMALLAPALAWAAWRRAAHATQARIAFRALEAWFVVVAALQWGFVIWPHNMANRDGFVRQMLRLKFLAGAQGLNVSAILGLCACCVVLAAWCKPRLARATALGFAIAAGVLLIAALRWPDWFMQPASQFFARDIPALLSLPLAALAALALGRPQIGWPAAGVAAGPAMVILVISTLLFQVMQARAWADSVAAFREALQGKPGIVAWEDVVAIATPERRLALRRVNWGWTMPDLSIVLTDGGEVRRLVRNPAGHGWQPWDPDDRATWPASALFVIRTSP